MNLPAMAATTMAARMPRIDALPATDAERLGALSTDTGRAIVVGWPDALRDRALIPARMWLHKGPDADTNILGWASAGTAPEVWLVSKGGRVDVYNLPALRTLLLDTMRGPHDHHRCDLVETTRGQRRVYRPTPMATLAPAHRGTFFPPKVP